MQKTDLLGELSTLDEDTIPASVLPYLCEGYRTSVDVFHVSVKTEAGDNCAAGSVTVSEGLTLLQVGLISEIQVRYVHKCEEWWDTVYAVPGGYRVQRTHKGS